MTAADPAYLFGAPESKALTGPPADDGDTGVMLALYPPPDVAAAMAIDGGMPAGELHVTVAYLGKTDAVDAGKLSAVADNVAGRAPVEGKFSGLARFAGDDPERGDALVALFDSAALEDLRRDVVDALGVQGIPLNRDHGYTAHMTLGYLGTDDKLPVERLEARPVTFTGIAAVHGPDRTDVPFKTLTPAEAQQNADLSPQPPADAGAPASGGQGLAAMVAGETKAAFPGAAMPFGGKGGGDAGPKIATGAFVQLGNRKGKVDLVVTSGTVPGATLPSGQPAEGSKASPAARVVIYEPGDGGTWKATKDKVAASVGKLKRIPPLNTREAKSLDEAFAGLLTDHHADGAPPVPADVLHTVYGRGCESWPGETKTALSRSQWGLGRTAAFLAATAGHRPDGYTGDDDLLTPGT